MQRMIFEEAQGLQVVYFRESFDKATRHKVEIRHGNGELVVLYGPHIASLTSMLEGICTAQGLLYEPI